VKPHIKTADLSAYMDDTLSSEARAQVEKHIRNCPDCLDKLCCFHKLNAQFQSLPSETIGFDLTAMINARLDKPLVQHRIRWWHRPSWRLVPIPLAASFVLFFGIYVGNGLITQSQQSAIGARLVYLAVLDPIPSAYSCGDFMSCKP